MSAVHSSFSYNPATDVCYRTLDFLGFPGYRVGDDGSVWSCLKPGSTTIGLTCSVWKSLKLSMRTDDRLGIVLRSRGLSVNKTVHKLVLSSFFGPCSEGMECCHCDGVPTNNRLANLRWDTHKNNLADRIKHGTLNQGERHGMAKLTEQKVRHIRELFASGEFSKTEISHLYGIHKTTVGHIIRRLIWDHVS